MLSNIVKVFLAKYLFQRLMNREEVRQFLSKLSDKELEYIKSMIFLDSPKPGRSALEIESYSIEELRGYIQLVSDEMFRKRNPDYDKC
jgi:hypothetical protein